MGKLSEYKEVRKVFGERKGDPDLGIIEVYYAEDNLIHGLAYHCPCGCGHVIWTPINNVHKKQHYWQYKPGVVTLTPSVRWTCGCKAHFNITEGKVVWHSDSGK